MTEQVHASVAMHQVQGNGTCIHKADFMNNKTLFTNNHLFSTVHCWCSKIKLDVMHITNLDVMHMIMAAPALAAQQNAVLVALACTKQYSRSK